MKQLLSTTLTLALAITPLTGLANSPAPQTSFYIEPSFHAENEDRVSASLKNVSDNAYFYVEDSVWDSLDTLQQIELTKDLVFLGDEFDKNIYPNLRSLYGEEWNSQPKVTILVANISPDVAAFVNSADVMPGSPRSNERAMIYMGSSVVFSELAKHHLAHEFVHLIESSQKERERGIVEEEWLSEALAEYAPTYLGYNDNYKGSYLESRVQNYIANPSTALTDWNGTPADFGASSLFAHYLAGHYGEDLLRGLMQSNATGRQNVTLALQRGGHGETFSDVFTRWTVANYINTPALDESGKSEQKYSYANSDLSIANLRVQNTAEFSVFPGNETGISLMLPAGGAQWVRFVPGSLNNSFGGELEIDFSPSDRFTANMPLTYITTDLSGEARVHSVPQDGETSLSIDGFGSDVLSVVVVPANINSSDSSSLPDSAVYSLSLVMEEGENEDGGEVRGDTDFADGVLLREQGDTKVYVIKKAQNGDLYKRWIPTAEIFEQYGHLRWEDIIDVEAGILDEFAESRLIKFIGDYKVYEINESGTVKQWLNITAQEFESREYSWYQIYEVNEKEYNHYTTGNPKTQ